MCRLSCVSRLGTGQCSGLLFPLCRYSWCVRTINSVYVFVETYVSCDDAYSCTIPRAIAKVVCKYSKRLLVVVA